jgi:hypothetical protein
MSKAHTIHVKPVPATTNFVLWLSCPSGCVTGYLYGENEAVVRDAAGAVIYQHARHEIIGEN